jgi:uncharacterized membrane protein YesL
VAILAYGSKNARFMARLWDLFLLNLLWIVGSLPIVTVGISTIAAYSVMLKMVQDDDPRVIRDFLEAYRGNLRQGLGLSLLLVAVSGAAAVDFLLFEAVEGSPIFLLIIGMLTAAFLLLHILYAFPLAARYENTVYHHLTNSRQIFIRYFVRTIACLALVAGEVWLFLFNGMLMMYVGFFLLPILVISTVSAFSIKIFRQIEKEGGVLPAEV